MEVMRLTTDDGTFFNNIRHFKKRKEQKVIVTYELFDTSN